MLWRFYGPRTTRLPDVYLQLPSVTISPLEEHVEKKEIPPLQTSPNITGTVTPDSLQLEKLEGAKLQEQLRAQELLAATATAPIDLVETKDAAQFHAAIEAAKNSGKLEDIAKGTFGTKKSKWHGAAVHTYDVEK